MSSLGRTDLGRNDDTDTLKKMSITMGVIFGTLATLVVLSVLFAGA